LTQALMFGFALASTSAFGRRSRIVMVFDVTQLVYYIQRDPASSLHVSRVPPRDRLGVLENGVWCRRSKLLVEWMFSIS
jgi:hypothetical protein